jgi:ParB family transcriptional regulator, chromosome partitioning protein
MTEQLKMHHVPPGALQPNPWNTNKISDPANEQKLENSLRRFGFTRPIIARTLLDGQLEILGGEHRWRIAVRMGLETVPVVNLGLIDDQRAKEIGLQDNGRYGEDDALGLAALLKELGNGVLDFMPYSDAELESLINTANVNLDDLDSVDPGDLPPLDSTPKGPAFQVLRFKVPVEDTGWITKLIESVQRAEGFKDEDSLTNAGMALTSILKRAEKVL